jgi:putative heme-binding domain-containing protein
VARAAHVDPVDNWEKDTGRIYRIAKAAGKPTRVVPFDLTKLSSDELVNQLTNRNGWFQRAARQLLAERRDETVIPRLRQQARQIKDGPLALQSLWALNVSGGFDDATAAALLEHPFPPVRMWTVRLLGDTRKLSPKQIAEVATLAHGEKDARVRRQLACSAKRWPATGAWPVIRELLHHGGDTNDLHIPLLLWWAIEDKITAHGAGDAFNALLASASDWDQPLMRDHILERLARRTASGLAANANAATACAWLLDTAATSAQRAAVLRGFDKAWEGQRVMAVAGPLGGAFARTWARQANDPLTLRVGLRLAQAEAQSAAIARLTNAAVPEAERAALAETLGQCGLDAAVPALLRLLGDKARLQTAAVAALQNFSRDDIATALLAAYPRLAANARTQTRIALAARANWAVQLVRAVEAGRFEAKELSPDLLRQMVRHNDAALQAAIEMRWGKLQAQSSQEKLSAINQFKLVLNPSGTTHRFKPDLAEGKKLYTQACAGCHKLFGEGASLGPELTGSDRKNIDWLLPQIVDPSAFIRPEFVSHNVEMNDGRSLSGLIAGQTDAAVTLIDARGERTVLNRAGIKEIAPSATSLMPEGLLEAWQPQQVRDLFGYLQAAQ